MDLNQLNQGLTLYFLLLCSLTVHEWAHAFVADKLGDPTPGEQGRVTLNPLAHIDPIGTVALPLVMILFPMGFAIFGWGKPVMTQPSYYKWGPRLGDVAVALAGPISNIIMGSLAALAAGWMVSQGHSEKSVELVGRFIYVNALLAAFNLLPIPPLDGSHVARHLIRMSDDLYYKIARYGFLIVLLMINIPYFRVVLQWAFAIVYVPMGMAYSVFDE